MYLSPLILFPLTAKKINPFLTFLLFVDNPSTLIFFFYLGRIQINLNNGKKRKFLYFQSDYKIKQNPSNLPAEEGEGDKIQGFGLE